MGLNDSTIMKRSLQTQQSEPSKCPRCDSTNTKFCYYNNYNKTQPRHFCKACKRYWTKGGTLRNVPVGGGRKNKKIKLPTTTTIAAAAPGLHDHNYMFPDDNKGLFFKPIIDSDQLDQISWDFNGGFIGMPPPPHQNVGFSILSNDLTSMNTNPNPIIPTSVSNSPMLSGFKDYYSSTLTTTTTTRMMVPNYANVSQPWMQVPTTSNFLDTNYWNWNDIDTIVQAHDLNKPFEDAQK